MPVDTSMIPEKGTSQFQVEQQSTAPMFFWGACLGLIRLAFEIADLIPTSCIVLWLILPCDPIPDRIRADSIRSNQRYYVLIIRSKYLTSHIFFKSFD
jgi:hypothetical protein